MNDREDCIMIVKWILRIIIVVILLSLAAMYPFN